jgi:hypothetical protein
MQFDYRKRRGDCSLRPDANRHLALDREIRVGGVFQGIAGCAQLAAEKSAMDWSVHSELFDYAGTDAAALLAGNSVTGDATQPRNLNLYCIGLIEA